MNNHGKIKRIYNLLFLCYNYMRNESDIVKKLFGGIDLTWKKLIFFAVLSGIYTALMAIIPGLKYTSFNTITVSFEVWILFGIIIIMNSKSNKDAALKCFVFFLISQPLIYLLQVPFSWQHWKLFSYYKFWFIWTIFCLPMGYIGYYMKKKKWWGYLILLPMIILTAFEYMTYLAYFTFSYPKYLLICLFCIWAMIIYPLYIFENKKIRTIGVVISSLLIIIISIYGFMNPLHYKTQIIANGENYKFDDTYKVYLEDKRYGKVEIVYLKNIEDYMVQVDFIKEGKTKITLEDVNGNKKTYNLDIKRDTYKISE